MLIDFVHELSGLRLKDVIVILDDWYIESLSESPCQMMNNFYVYTAILEGLTKIDDYDFDHHKGSADNFFLFNEEELYEQVLQYEKSQVCEIVGTKITDGTMPLVCWESETTSMFITK